MAWNEPGGDKQDPWGGGGGGQQPPDLDEVVRKLQARFNGLFGGRKGGGGPRTGKSGGLGFIGLIVVAVWLASGFYIVGPAERGVVTRFGAYVSPPVLPGPHWHLPYPMEQVEKVDVDQVRPASIKALMLTKDENIVSVDLAVQYRVKDPAAYLFNGRDPDLTLSQAAESAVREVVGKSQMDYVLTEGRAEVGASTQQLLQEALDEYGTGLEVTSVNLQDVQPPEQVQSAFEDAIRAREDEQRLKNEAEAYSNDVVPKARGAAARKIEEATAYKQSVMARAQGDASRFDALLTEYQKAPRVTRERLYLDTMQSVLSNSSKVLLDAPKGNSLMYLPIDRMLEGDKAAAPSPAEPSGTASGSASTAAGSTSNDTRSRGNR